jgi:hypothetical protein
VTTGCDTGGGAALALAVPGRDGAGRVVAGAVTAGRVVAGAVAAGGPLAGAALETGSLPTGAGAGEGVASAGVASASAAVTVGAAGGAVSFPRPATRYAPPARATTAMPMPAIIPVRWLFVAGLGAGRAGGPAVGAGMFGVEALGP